MDKEDLEELNDTIDILIHFAMSIKGLSNQCIGMQQMIGFIDQDKVYQANINSISEEMEHLAFYAEMLATFVEDNQTIASLCSKRLIKSFPKTKEVPPLEERDGM